MSDMGLELKFNGELYLATRHNTMLFTFFYEPKYDHVYSITEQRDDSIVGGYIWNDHSVYETLVEFIQTHRFQQRLNSVEVADCDKDAWQQAHPNGLYLPDNRIALPKPDYDDVKDLYFNDSFPEEWEQ